MRKIIAIAFLSLCTFLYSAAQHAVQIYLDKEEQPDVFLNVNIDSITIENGNQVFATKQGKVEYPLAAIDSIKFQGKFFKAIYPQIKLLGVTQDISILTMTEEPEWPEPLRKYKEKGGQIFSWFDPFKNKTDEEIEGFFQENPDDIPLAKLYREISKTFPQCDMSGVPEDVYCWSNSNFGENALISSFRLRVDGNEADTRKFTININYGDETVPIEITQYGDPLFWLDGQPFDQNCHLILPPEAQSFELKMPKTIIDSISFATDYYGDYVPCDWIKTTAKNDSTFIISVDENLSNSIKIADKRFHCSIKTIGAYLQNYKYVIQMNRMHSAEEHRKALREFYNATDGDNWTYKENWWSDKPYYKWDCINDDLGGYNKYWGDRVVSMQFSGRQFNGMRGMIPESFTVFMDDLIGYLDISDGALSGRFPDAVCNHPLWQEIGWTAIQQKLWYGANIDFTGINLKLPEVEVTDYLTNTRKSTSEILKENELTFIIHRSYSSSNNCEEVGFINKYLDYAPNGFGMVIAKDQGDGQNSEGEVQSYSAIIREMQAKGIPEGIVWTNHFGNANVGPVGSMSLIDKDGNLIWYAPMDWDLGGYENVIDMYCRKILGEPVEHDQFVYDTYTSTDYSQDGEIITIQKASEGNGIDLVFMGDGYVDKDINGTYIDDMNGGINELFAIEPLKSLKPRFNIHIVKVVSPNECVNNGTQRLNNDANNVYEYVGKIQGVTPENAHVCVIANRPSEFSVSGYAEMNDNGGSIAWINLGKVSSIIVHEAGGHGIGKLLDEYLTGHDDSSLNDEEKEQLRQQLKGMYHDREWGLNLSLYREPEKSPWAHMFNDDDYKNEVGMYQGAWMFPTVCWRSSENSVMNNDYSWFNAPSREAIYRHVMKASEGDSWEFNFADFKQFDKVHDNQPEESTLSMKAVPDENNILVVKSAPRRLMKNTDGKYVSVALGDEPDGSETTIKQKSVPEKLSNGLVRIERELPNIKLSSGQYLIIGGKSIEGK